MIRGKNASQYFRSYEENICLKRVEDKIIVFASCVKGD